jgi:tetratricopeptide (TPR) repeat protein
MALVAAIGLAIGMGCRDGTNPGPRPSDAAVAESLDSAIARQDVEQALDWATELAARQPNSSVAQRRLAVAWHQFGWIRRPGSKGTDLPLRTSLDRIECERRAMAAADSARKLAQNPGEWVAGVWWYGQSLEHLGFPVEALACYAEIERRVPQFQPAQARAAELRALLVDPVGGHFSRTTEQ